MVLFLVILLAGITSEARESIVVVSGSSTVMPLAELAAEEFNIMQDDYTFNVKSGALSPTFIISSNCITSFKSYEIH